MRFTKENLYQKNMEALATRACAILEGNPDCEAIDRLMTAALIALSTGTSMPTIIRGLAANAYSLGYETGLSLRIPEFVFVEDENTP